MMVLFCFIFKVCRNINRIKVCMETGRTVILLNLESLYESLYDALNQVWIDLMLFYFTCALLGRVRLSTLYTSGTFVLSNPFRLSMIVFQV